MLVEELQRWLWKLAARGLRVDADQVRLKGSGKLPAGRRGEALSSEVGQRSVNALSNGLNCGAHHQAANARAPLALTLEGQTSPPADNVMPIAYLMSRFPTITETFILFEILELRRSGQTVHVFPLLAERSGVVHPEVKELDGFVHYTKPFSRNVLSSQLFWLRKHTRAYVDAWWSVLRGVWRSPKFLSRAVVVVPLAATFAREMRPIGIRHVHAHWATHPTLAAFVIRRLVGIPYSFTAHAHDIYVDQTMLREKIRHASFVVTISCQNLQLLLELCDQKDKAKINLIRCGVDPEVFHANHRHRSIRRFTITCIASYEEKKGHRYLIDACAALRARGLDFECLLVGEGPERGKIERQIARLGLSNCIKLVGVQPRPRVRELLGRSDVMVLPSIALKSGKREGIPVALMEASAMEVPVVATNVSGIPELVEDGRTGLLVPEREVSALTDAIWRLVESADLRSELGGRARIKVLAEFDLRANVRELRGLIGCATHASAGGCS